MSPIVVLDTNKIIAAILRPGRVRRNLLAQQCTFITPPHAWDEVEEHIVEIAQEKKVPVEKLARLLARIKEEVVIEVVPVEPIVSLARGLAGGFDPDDWPFVALAAQYGAPIWTNDRELIHHSLRTGKYRAIDTEGLEMLLEGKPWEQVVERMREKYVGH